MMTMTKMWWLTTAMATLNIEAPEEKALAMYLVYGFNAGNQFHHNHLKGSKWLSFVTGCIFLAFSSGLFYWQIPLFLLFSSASAGFRVVGHSSNILSSFNIGEIRLPSDSVYGCWTNCNVNFYLMGVIILAVSLGLLI
ncbi:hypothetical protein CUMW_269890 [Citrus unshiu]|uniref:Uncharacterized protein n=1 Tax=Citrus unshiu TaxID=55188 RepID=A0A2H5QX28_CITUN|nr:hypothetical protein CUMW_269890 [Citrus unshiu]